MTTQEEKELREEWREEVKRWPQMDALASADYWINKLKSHDAEMVEKVKEFEKLISCSPMHTIQGSNIKICHQCSHDGGYNHALGNVLALFNPKGN